jgi:hypothetical protein
MGALRGKHSQGERHIVVPPDFFVRPGTQANIQPAFVPSGMAANK